MTATQLPVPAEELGITAHGTAEILDVSGDEHEGFRDYCTGIYGRNLDQLARLGVVCANQRASDGHVPP